MSILGIHQRSIKFRAWIPAMKKMETGLFGLRSDGKASFNNDAILMQFTGLLDSDKVEIFEGDIIQFRSMAGWYNQFSELYLIEFKAQDLGAHSFHQTIGWNATRIFDGKITSHTKGIRDIFHTSELIRTEVIGNIYEDLKKLTR